MATYLRLKQFDRPTFGGWDPERQLAEALAERDGFLEENPQYGEMQREIDRMLDKAGSSQNRMAVLAMLMEAKLIELHGQLKSLNRILLRTAAT